MKARKYRALDGVDDQDTDGMDLEDDALVCDDADDSLYEDADLDRQQWLDGWRRRAHLDEDAWLERELENDF